MESIEELYEKTPYKYTFMQDVFARAARKDKFLTYEEKRRDGAKRFKRAALGFFKWKNIKTLDEMAQLLYDTGIASSLEEGKRAVPLIAGDSVNYDGLFFDHISIEEVEKNKEKRYKIQAFDSS